MILKGLLMVYVITALLLVGTTDYIDAQNAQVRYCDDVSSGKHPDYKGTFDAECNK